MPVPVVDPPVALPEPIDVPPVPPVMPAELPAEPPPTEPAPTEPPLAEPPPAPPPPPPPLWASAKLDVRASTDASAIVVIFIRFPFIGEREGNDDIPSAFLNKGGLTKIRRLKPNRVIR